MVKRQKLIAAILAAAMSISCLGITAMAQEQAEISKEISTQQQTQAPETTPEPTEENTPKPDEEATQEPTSIPSESPVPEPTEEPAASPDKGERIQSLINTIAPTYFDSIDAWTIMDLVCGGFLDDITTDKQIFIDSIKSTEYINDVEKNALALHVFAPYYLADTYEEAGISEELYNQIKEAVPQIVNALSHAQLPNGSLSSSNTDAMTIIGLCALGINPDTDERFISEEYNSLVDGIDSGYIRSVTTPDGITLKEFITLAKEGWLRSMRISVAPAFLRHVLYCYYIIAV